MNRAVLCGLLVAAGAAVIDISRYAREQTQRADGWREEYFALLDAVDERTSDDSEEESG